MEVSEIMSKDLVTVGPEYNVADVASLMRSRKIGSVIVLEDARVEEAAGEMVRAGVRHLPVISEQGLIGIVSMRDLVRWSVRGVAESTDLPHIELSKQVLSIVHKVGK